MDITNEYVLMCGRADFIQKLFIEKLSNKKSYLEGSWIALDDKPIQLTSSVLRKTSKEILEDSVWLPDFYDFQEILYENKKLTWTDVREFENFCFDVGCLLPQKGCTSYEKLYLMFFMYSKHNRLWNGKTWNTPGSAELLNFVK